MLKDIFNKLQKYPLPDVVHFLIIPALALWIAVFIPFTVSVSLNTASSDIVTNNSSLCQGGNCIYCDPLSSPLSLTDLFKEKLPGDLLDGFTGQDICRNPDPLPGGCVKYDNTAGIGNSADWLWCWNKKGVDSPLSNFFVGKVLYSCALSDDQIKNIAHTCDALESPLAEKLSCIMKAVNSGLSNSKLSVCAHHARCVELVLLETPIANHTIVGKKLGLIAGHGWNQVGDGNGTHHIDAYNKVHFWCPNDYNDLYPKQPPTPPTPSVGSIEIVNNTAGGDGTFQFTTKGYGFDSFPLTTSGGINSKTISDLEPGSNYSISQNIKDGWDLNYSGCNRGTPAAIEVVAGEITTCYFYNTKKIAGKGSLKIVANTTNGDDIFYFNYNFGVPKRTYIATKNRTNFQTISNLEPGSNYSISEDVPDGWNLDKVYCYSDSTGPVGVGVATSVGYSDINMKADDTVTCIFTNTLIKKISLVIFKNTTGGTPGGESIFNYLVKYKDPQTGAGQLYSTKINTSSISQTNINLLSGVTYDITEDTLPPGWEFVSVSCNPESKAVLIPRGVRVAITEPAYCTFENKYNAPSPP